MEREAHPQEDDILSKWDDKISKIISEWIDRHRVLIGISSIIMAGLLSLLLYYLIHLYFAPPHLSGLFTGVGLFDNPTGATPNTTGQVKFEISLKNYTDNQPAGNVSMNFENANFIFTAISFDYFVTSGNKAYVKGTGRLYGIGTSFNGVNDYTFLASGIDGHDTGGSDKIRFQIKDSSNNVIYDSQPNAGDDADPTTSLTGQVIVH